MSYVNNIITQKVIKVNDLQKQNVVQENTLIDSLADMDLAPLKLFELAVSCIDTENPPEDNTVSLEKETIFSFFDTNHKNKYDFFRNAIKKLHEQSFFEVKELKEKGKFKYRTISPVQETEWSDVNNIVKIKFTDSVMPFLLELNKGNFTQYAIADIGKLESFYSIVIYKWLRKDFNKFEKYSKEGTRTEKQLEQWKNPKISVDELRRITNTTDMYKRFDSFERGVLERAVEEINQKTDFKITYDKIRTGRPIGIIKFHIDREKLKAPLPYKEEDESAIESTRRKIKELDDVFSKAVAHKYTEQLANSELITASQMINKDLMYVLYTKVYPIYDEIGSIGGNTAIRNHHEYVKGKMIDYDEKKKNIAQYLRKSAEDYLRKLKINYTSQ